MPITPRDYERRPYVRPAYEPDTRTVMELMRAAGQSRANAIGRRGQARAEGLMTLGQMIGQALQSQRVGRERQQIAEMELAEKRANREQDEAYRRDQLAALTEEREAARQIREDQQRRLDQADAYKRGGEIAEDVKYGPLQESQVDPLMAGPAANRVRYAFGPGTAEGPELQPNREQQDAINARQAVERMGGTIGPNGQVVMPPKEPTTPNPTEYSLAWAAAQGDPVARRALEIRNQVQQKPPSENQPLVPIVGADGKTRYGTREEARGQVVPSGQNKPATGLEKRALNFFNRAKQADDDMEVLEPQIAALNLAGQTRMQYAPNFAQSQLGQSYRQAQRAFTEARLRKDSGAAIPEQEYENDARTYFAQPGDSPQTLADKRRGRAAVLASLGFESGQALGEFVGDAEEARAIVQGYRQRSQKAATVDQVPQGALRPGQTVNVGGFTVTVRPPQ